MSIRNPTVLILGAASSLHCGYPLGLNLIANVALMRQETSMPPLPKCWTSADLKHFVTRLSRSGHYSIDAFLETVPAEIDLGKYLIAFCLKQKEDVDKLFPPNNSGWYQYLFNCLLNVDGDPFANNHLTIVTYNYDRSLEAYLYHALISRFAMTEDEAKKELTRIPIIHVHGSLGNFPDVPYATSDNVDKLYEISQSIKIIHEIKDHNDKYCNEEFRRSHNAVNNASKIVFLGFGFHYDNVRRLNVKWAAFSEKEVLSTFWDTSTTEYEQIMRRLSDLGLSSEILPFVGGNNCNDFFRFDTSLT